ncbi:steroid delta-isomerase [Rhodococcus spelaei]|uniref:Steroid delta-isomerase n=1 Tax=Rhodococcus spelaei TaxID=2546320 RepID=A0A541BQQ7_9NOCA|nr:nuclear transport factor 2 family protein [Rhodococcus spelaei]TQF74646.1 steroid delta-isomerase [Rhodococcus spelaei]
MASPDDIRAAVTRYLAAVGGGTSADVAALYADDATLEDPVGTEPKVGREAIEKFYSALDAVQNTTELLSLRVAGNSAAFHFRVVTDTGEQTVTIEPIDVMTFDDQARITSMRAFWSPEDMVVA